MKSKLLFLLVALMPLLSIGQIQVNKVDTVLGVVIGNELVEWKSKDWTIEQIRSGANLPDWVKYLRADRVGGLNISEGGAYNVGSSYIDATMLLAGSGTNFDNYTLRFPRLTGIPYKRHMIIFNVNIENITLEPLENAKLKNIPNKAKVDDIWTLTYDSFSNSWHLEAINSMPKWYIDSKVSKDDLSMMPEAGKVPIFSSQGLLSTGMPLFPENAIPLQYLNVVLPPNPTTGTHILKSINGVSIWVEE